MHPILVSLDTLSANIRKSPLLTTIQADRHCVEIGNLRSAVAEDLKQNPPSLIAPQFGKRVVGSHLELVRD